MINKFDGQYDWLSNFYNSPVIYQGLSYKNVESAYQSAKLASVFQRINFCELNPSEAKKMGRKVILRIDWKEVKENVMFDCILDKFLRVSSLGNALLATGTEELVEGNYWHDNLWGSCNCPKCENIVGQNILGQILMRVRRNLRDLENEFGRK